MGIEIKRLREFGKFRLDAESRVLWFENEPVALPLKEIELLCVLTENGGEVVSKEELLNRIWAESFVEESNLSRHIYLLRKTFKKFGASADLIQTVPRRGYRFTGEIHENGGDELVIKKHTLTQTLIEIQEPQREGKKSPLASFFLSRKGFSFTLILTAVITLGGLFSFFGFQDAGSKIPLSEVKSVAVLPVKNLTGNQGDDFLADGITESLMTELSRINGLKVISSLSVFSFKNKETDSAEIGRKLGVNRLLESSLRREGDEIRVETRLINAETGEIVWNETYRRNLEEIIVVQDGIACDIAAELRTSLCGQKDRVPNLYTKNVKAYQAYMKGRFYWYQRGDKPLEKAIAEYEDALRFDPNYALAYAGLAETYIVQEANSTGTPGETLPKAVINAEKALQLDPNLAGAYSALGMARRIEGKLNEAEKMFQRAIEINPNYSTAWHWRATTLRVRGRFSEAEEAIKKARELDPLSVPISLTLGEIYFSLRQYERVLEQAGQIFSISPENENGYFLLTEGYEMLGRYDEALIAVEKVHPLNARYLKACLLARAGRREESLQIVAELENSEIAVKSPYNIARIYSSLGDKEKTFLWLENAYRIRQPFLLYLKGEPRFDLIRSDARYDELLKKLNLAE